MAIGAPRVCRGGGWAIKNARCSKNASCMKKARCRMNGVPPAGEELGGSSSMGVHGPRLPVL